MGQSVMRIDWFALFKVKITGKAHTFRYECFHHIFWTADLFAFRFNGMVHHHKMECRVKIGLLCSRSRSHCGFKTSFNLWLSYVVCTNDFLATKSIQCVHCLSLITKPITIRWACADSKTDLQCHKARKEERKIFSVQGNYLFFFFFLTLRPDVAGLTELSHHRLLFLPLLVRSNLFGDAVWIGSPLSPTKSTVFCTFWRQPHSFCLSCPAMGSCGRRN